MDDDMWKEYYLALGEFVTTFAWMEEKVLVALHHVCKVDRGTAQSIFSGTRTRDAISFIRRIYEARKEPFPKDLNDALTHLVAINTTRDQILHWGASYGLDGLEVTNERRAHAERAVVTIPVSPKILSAMSLDLWIIDAVIELHITKKQFAKAQSMDGTRRFALRPWTYKPAQRTPKGPPTAKVVRKQLPQPKSSRE